MRVRSALARHTSCVFFSWITRPLFRRLRNRPLDTRVSEQSPPATSPLTVSRVTLEGTAFVWCREDQGVKSGMAKTTVVVADDHPLVRQGLRALLESEQDFTVIGEAMDGLTTVHVVEQLRPDVLLLDVMMGGLNGLEVARRVSRLAPKTRVVILSMHANEPYVLEALRHGVAGYILKEASPDEVLRGLREVAAGGRFLSTSLSERAIDAYARSGPTMPLDLYETLTAREREVLQLTAEECTATEIAARLGISPRTVESHRMAFMRKLGLHSQADLIRYAIRQGILPMDCE